MSVIIFHKETKLPVQKSRQIAKNLYETVGAAKAALTRAERATHAGKKPFVASEYAIVDIELYNSSIRPPVEYEWVPNLMSGKLVRQAVGTPRCCDVSSELYWSM
jgi:hypothetical protein